MRRAILFRYHAKPGLCLNRIMLLRRLNPGMPIYGMYGGPHASPPSLPCDHNYVLPFASPRFKWQHGDLCARQWFIDRGHDYRFDMLHMVEWDLVYLKPVEELFRGVNDGIAVTGIKTLHQWRKLGWEWIVTPHGNERLQELRAFVHRECSETFNDERQVAGLFPGASLSRAFLERYAEIEPPALLNDEIRTPLFAQAFGMKVHDTGFRKNNPYFDCGKRRFRAAAGSKYKVLHHIRDKVF